MVLGGMVLTVSGPIRVSTYSVSGYALSFTPVEAHSRRCGMAPLAASAFQRSLAIISRYQA